MTEVEETIAQLIYYHSTSHTEEEALDHIIYCLATRQIPEAGVREDGDYYVIEVGGRYELARFPLAGRDKRDIRRILFNGVCDYVEKRKGGT